MLKSYEGVRQQKALEYRERVASFQVRKKIIQRKTGQDLFLLLRDIEKETLARMRRSRFGENDSEGHKLLINRLVLSEDGRDDYLCAEQYVMLGNWDRDPDRFIRMREITCEFLRSLRNRCAGRGCGTRSLAECPRKCARAGRRRHAQRIHARRPLPESAPLGLGALLEDQSVMEYVIASYEVVPLLSEYASRINPQQLKNALVDRAECARVERLIQEGGKLSANNLYAAVGRVASCRGADRAKVAGRFLRDFLRYHRDMRRLEALNSALDSINLIGNAKLRELSAVNGTLYEFLLNRRAEARWKNATLGHVIIKADIRDSSRLTRSLMDSGLNPASYFSLNFYDPVNKLLPKYGASKVFIEGDAVILALHEKEGEAGLGGEPSLRAGPRDRRNRARLQRTGHQGWLAAAGTRCWHLLPGGFSALPDGRREAHHDLRSAERERPAVFLQQARPQGHGAAGQPVPRVCLPDRERRGCRRGRRRFRHGLQPGRHRLESRPLSKNCVQRSRWNPPT